jgi:hypothetical protein
MHGLTHEQYTIARMNNTIYIPENGVPTLEQLQAKHRLELDRISVTHAKEVAELPEKQRVENERIERERKVKEARASHVAAFSASNREHEARIACARSKGKTVWIVTDEYVVNDGTGGKVLEVYSRQPTDEEVGFNDVEEFELND